MGPENDATIQRLLEECPIAVAAWGAWWRSHNVRANGIPLPRIGVERYAETRGRTLMCLGRTKYGDPRHPLYVPNATPLEVYSS